MAAKVSEDKVFEIFRAFALFYVEEFEFKLKKYWNEAEPGKSGNPGGFAPYAEYVAKGAGGASGAGLSVVRNSDMEKDSSDGSSILSAIVPPLVKARQADVHQTKVKKIVKLLDKFIYNELQLRHVLCEAAGRIFQALEYQFVVASGDPRFGQKITEDVVKMTINYLREYKGVIQDKEDLLRKLTFGVVLTNSACEGVELTFENSKVDLWILKMDIKQNAWKTVCMMTHPGIYDKATGTFYTKPLSYECDTKKYGYRLPLEGEEDYKILYTVDQKPKHYDHAYVLDDALLDKWVADIFDEINKADPLREMVKILETSKNNLKKNENIKNKIQNIRALTRKNVDSSLETLPKLKSITKDQTKTILGLEEISRKEDDINDRQQYQGRQLDRVVKISDETYKKLCQATMKISKVTQTIPDSVSPEGSEKRFFNVDKPVENYLGRTHELQLIEQSLAEGTHYVVITQNDFESLGCSELTRQFVHKYFNGKACNAIWIHGNNTFAIINSFEIIAQEMGINIHNKSIKDIVHEIFYHLMKSPVQRKTLFIFDNVKHFKDLQDILPFSNFKDYKDIHIIITCKTSSCINLPDAVSITLKKFESNEALEFMKSSLKIDLGNTKFDGDIHNLNEQLQFYPLTLSLAAAYMKLKRIRTPEYSFNDYLTDLSIEDDTVDSETDPFKRILLKICYLSIDYLNRYQNVGERALEIICLVAYISQHSISIEQFLGTPQDTCLKEALDLLKKLNLIKVSNENVTIHSLIQEAIRNHLNAHDKGKDCLRKLLKIENLWNFETLQKDHILQNHAANVIDHIMNYEDNSILKELQLCPKVNSLLLRCFHQFGFISTKNKFSQFSRTNRM